MKHRWWFASRCNYGVSNQSTHDWYVRYALKTWVLKGFHKLSVRTFVAKVRV